MRNVWIFQHTLIISSMFTRIAILLCPLWLFAQKPNIIVILADDLGNGEIGFNNSDYSTPNIDTLCANGAYFSQFYATPQCTPSRYAFLTGKYPIRDGMQEGVCSLFSEKHMSNSEVTLPEMLASEGYMCGMVGKWHLGNAHPEYLPHNNGFQYWYGNSDAAVEYNTHTRNAGGPYDLYENGITQTDISTYYTELIGSKAVSFIEGVAGCGAGNPFFLWVAFTAPHTPYQAPADTVSLAPGAFSTDRKKKWAQIRIMDNEIGKIMDAVVAAGVENETIIIFTSDNGATDTYYLDSGVGNNTPYRGHKFQLWEGGLRVPMAWYHPGTVSPVTVTKPAHLVDLLPTLIEGQVGDIVAQDVDGTDISAMLQGDTIPDRPILLNLIVDRNWAVVKGRWKLANNPATSSNADSTLSSSIRLYDVVNDEHEDIDVSGTYPSIVSELQAYIDTWEAEALPVQPKSDSTPGGWVNFPVIADPKTYYDPTYYFFRPY